MVERDRFEKQFGAGWLAAYRYVREGNASLEEVCDKLTTALTKRLRDWDGVPLLHRMAQILTNARETGLLPAFMALDDIVQECEGHPHTMIAAEVAKTLIVQREATVWSSEASKIPGIFAEAVCSALVERNYFAKARHPLIYEGVFANYEAATQWQTQLEESLQPQLTILAARLEKHPDGKGLWAPNRRVKKERTSDLLEENLLPARTSNQPSVGTSR